MIFKGLGYLDKENGFKKQDDFAPFPSGITFPLASYAQIDDDCIDSTITDFLQNISFILLGKNKHFYFSPILCKGLSRELFQFRSGFTLCYVGEILDESTLSCW